MRFKNERISIMKKMLLSLIMISALSFLSFDTQASFCGMFRSAYKTVAGVVVGTIDVGIEAVGIVIPGIDRSSRKRKEALNSNCCCYSYDSCDVYNEMQ